MSVGGLHLHSLVFPLLMLLLKTFQSAQAGSPDVHVAVCFWGLTRSLWATKDSLRHSVFDPLALEDFKIATFLHTFNVESEWGDKEFWEQYKWLRPDRVLVESLSDVDKSTSTPSLETLKLAGDAFNNNFQSLTNLRFALYSLDAVTSLWTAHSQKYDLVLYTRSDIWFFHTLNISEVQLALKSESVFIPDFDSWGGLNDRFAFGRPDVMQAYGSRLQLVPEYTKSSPLHSETFLAYVMESKKVDVKPSSMRFTRVRASGEIWSLPQNPREPGYSDGWLHNADPPKKQFNRTGQGFLELAPLHSH